MSEDMYDPNAQDQLTRERGRCLTKNCDVRLLFKELRECQKRIKSKTYTAETCHQETVDLIEGIDHCVADKAFIKLK